VKNRTFCTLLGTFSFLFLSSLTVFGQDQPMNETQKKETENSKSEESLEKKAVEWAKSLELNDNSKESAVTKIIAAHLTAVRDWHNDHPYTIVPDGINPVNGERLNKLHRQMIADSAIPKSVHDSLMSGLHKYLTDDQVEKILDKYTVGKVQFTMNGYKSIVPDLKPEEETKILAYLKQAREQAIDYKNMNEISGIFEIYKTKCEQYLNSNGRNWHELFSAYVKAAKAKKEAEKNKQSH